ncbi:RecF/RecN/SMC [Lipomyces oligophaga]|uniref:RecF/RecN/SMC n=1 Tax=Lipomyces oligophaga TaxID=45792 RepID=UPI0034CF9904
MHIKQLVIQGFKSYKDQTVTEPFSPHHNVIVGRNGSGKSNFFAAIRFVLSDAYTHMSREERQALLHEGSGTAVMSAYVEIIFDNSDRRFPTGADEVILRRTIGLKKDEYSLDRKSASKSDVMNLLESAGFSRSNPYYIVPQGRVTALTNAKDAERLVLLKEVAGTQVYEQRRVDSLKVMTESNTKREKVDELLESLDERLNELEEEKEELKEFQEKDRERRSYEYVLQDRELKEINSHLEQIEDERARNSIFNNDRLSEFAERDNVIQSLENEINSLKHRIEFIDSDTKHCEQDHRELIRNQAQLEVQLRNAHDEEQQNLDNISRREQELRDVVAKIQESEHRLTQLTPAFEEALTRELEIKKALADAEGTQQLLYGKQGRNARFSSKADRDRWLRKEIQDISNTIDQRESLRQDIQLQMQDLQKRLDEVRKSTEDINVNLESAEEKLNKFHSEQAQIKAARDVLLDSRKELWREDSKTKSELDNTRSELDRAERMFSGTMDRSQSAGLSAVRQITKRLSLDGVYGPLCELFDVDDKYKTAVEVTAGNSLFHVVVDTDATASRIMEILNRERLGRVTFMPLNRLRSKKVIYPHSDEVIPLIAKLRYRSEYRQAVEQVFSKTIICYNLESSSQYARSHGLSAITLQGDQADKKGVLTGGYHDHRRSRIDAVKGIRYWRDEYEKIRNRCEDIVREINKKDQEITKLVGDATQIEAEWQQLIKSLVSMKDVLQQNRDRESRLKENLSTKQQLFDSTVTDLNSLRQQLDSLSKEMRSSFERNLSPAETEELSVLGTRIQNLRAQDAEVSNTRSTIEQEKVLLEIELQQVLYMRRDQLRTDGLEQDIEKVDGADVQSLTDSINHTKDSVLHNVAKIEEFQREREDLESEVAAKLSEMSKLQELQLDEARSIEREQKHLERGMARRGILVQRKNELIRNIRDLGALPEEAFEKKYDQIKSETMLKRLQKLNEELKAFSHINKKAFEQYVNFTRQREALITRREELNKSQVSIEELIQVLDQRKDEAIERTFKQVAKAFAEIFEKLVPAGRGRLIMQKRMDQEMRGKVREDEDEDEDEDDEAESVDEGRQSSSVENYVGVSISVSFNSKSDEQQRIEQLSGGQKSLCALALIFAIQRTDPAPFYLFDEIDANLDAQYRTAVASMIHELASQSEIDEDGNSQGAQFICTTFRNEMIYVADNFYGVLFNNKISSIAAITRENALTFVEGEQAR